MDRCSLCNRKFGKTCAKLAGMQLCWSCYARPRDKCTVCGKNWYVAKRKGGVVCRRCYKQPKGTCSVCGQHREIASRGRGRPLCHLCDYNRKMDDKFGKRPAPFCKECGSPLKKPRRHGTGRCKTCQMRWYARHRPKVKCELCGRMDRARYNLKGKVICGTCYARTWRRRKAKKP